MQAINNATRIAKAANKTILTDLCNTIDIEKQKRNLTIQDRIPDKLVYNLVASIRAVYPQITRHTITNEYRYVISDKMNGVSKPTRVTPQIILTRL